MRIKKSIKGDDYIGERKRCILIYLTLPPLPSTYIILELILNVALSAISHELCPTWPCGGVYPIPHNITIT